MKAHRVAAFVLWLVPVLAQADGAFPDSLGILLPVDQPDRIVVSTNFGLLVTDNNGTSWRYICEQAMNVSPTMYQMGPAPEHRLLAISYAGLAVSADNGCSWQLAGGTVADAIVVDAFPDPSDPLHVLAIVRPPPADGGLLPIGLHESHDGARTFGNALYVVSATSYLTGVEISRSEPGTVYMTRVDTGSQYHPYVLRTTDGGSTWAEFDGSGVVGEQVLYLAGVDPLNARRLYLRAVGLNNQDSLIISDDGGQTLRVAYTLPFRMSAFVRRANGDILVATAEGSTFISKDDGQTFNRLANSLHIRALGERNGLLFAVADNATDPFAVGVSRDDGTSWQPLLSFSQICGPLACGDVSSVCDGPWQSLTQQLNISPPRSCAADGGTSGLPQGRRCGCDGYGGDALVLLTPWVGWLLSRRRPR